MEQHLVGAEIAQPRHDALIEKCALDGQPTTSESVPQLVGGQRQQVVPEGIHVRIETQPAESAGVVESQRRSRRVRARCL